MKFDIYRCSNRTFGEI